ncbi:Flp pilus assembly complex ATPase component TadA [Candidatus Woesearchaeota archaeon]|nr:Flp pilus assembly complex ATPase component TadA [Candidatus Woesearchaeota archaeon]MBT6519576.1 Flp pilus assembly complex ATPase component TadA [Candidatus Woesearchaeota archaeon]MBT7367679.1 Flp pilus assembly complex ATPase component TadA [Candidatus Woesearchaeota archaeon]
MEIIVPDTSIIIDGILSTKLKSKELVIKKILIHEAVLAELENQANQDKTIGVLGLEEVKEINELSKDLGFEFEVLGQRPILRNSKDAKEAKLGSMDYLIRELAWENSACLLTSDKIQAKVAEAKGINCIYFKKDLNQEKKLMLESFFDEMTMSVHLRENVEPFAKKGRPGEWEFVCVRDKKLTRKEIKDISDEIIEEAGKRIDSFIEIERPGSIISQLGLFRIVITKPPFSDGWEITAVRPVKRLSLDDYELPSKVLERIEQQAEGMLIAGAPGQGKSTFAQALSDFYASKNKIVKTVEAPRDLILADNITQYAISHGTPEEVHDVLLLCRPDYTIFDEMRNTNDFSLFADLRLSGVGMVGIVHATNAIDAIQRFIGRLELGVIPQVIDTVVFIKNGEIGKIFEVEMKVKVPSGMVEADLARPVVCVSDFLTGKLEFELYSYGEETVVVPVSEEASSNSVSPAKKLAAKEIEKATQRYASRVIVEMKSEHSCIVKVPEKEISNVIGKQGKNVIKLEKELGLKIDVQAITADDSEGSTRNRDVSEETGTEIGFDVEISKKSIQFLVDPEYANESVDIYIEGEFLMEARVSKKAIIKLKKDNKIGKTLLVHIDEGDEIRMFV